jgi:outer membrane protein OmpU
MNTFKKIGLTALAGSLVVTSAYAGSMSVSGGASIGLKNTSKTATGKSWTMGNQLTFSGSGELDNGMDVSLSFVLDQADDSTTGIANAPFDSHSVTISSDEMGTLVFSGEGGSSAQSAIDTTAAGDLWDNGSGFTAIRSSEAGNNSMMYTLPSLMDDLTLKASYSPGGAGGGSATAWSVSYAGVEGLTLDYAVGDTNTIGSEQEHTTMKGSYAWGSFTISASNTESAYDAAASVDEEISSWEVAYTVSDDLSVSYGSETIDTEGSSVDEEAEGINVSYTTGGVTLSATSYEFSGKGNSTTESSSTGDVERWALSATFAF